MTAVGASDAGDFYDEVWDKYGHLDAVSPAAFHRRRVVTNLARQAAPRAGRILDIGCGRGELLCELARGRPGAALVGADVSERSLELSRRDNPSYEFLILDLERTDFRDAYAAQLETFDLITCCEVIEHIDDDRAAIDNLVALLAKGGHVIVTVPGGKMSRFDEIIGHRRHYRQRGLGALLDGAGLNVSAVQAWGFPFHNLYRTAVRVAARATMTRESTPSKKSGRISKVLGGAYGWFGRALKPLFYLNASRWGEQLIAVARKP